MLMGRHTRVVGGDCRGISLYGERYIQRELWDLATCAAGPVQTPLITRTDAYSGAARRLTFRVICVVAIDPRRTHANEAYSSTTDHGPFLCLILCCRESSYRTNAYSSTARRDVPCLIWIRIRRGRLSARESVIPLDLYLAKHVQDAAIQAGENRLPGHLQSGGLGIG